MIFRYIKGTLNMGLWYLKDSGFELTAFLDADHVGCLDTRKSSSGGIQFLGEKLVSWMSKKHDCIAMSTSEVEYVALSTSCAQVERGIIELYFVKTEYQIADMFTKALSQDRRRCSIYILAESYSLPYAHTQATKTYYEDQDSRIKKAKDHTKTSATLIFKIFLKDIKSIKTKIVSKLSR
nr:hypothetical protein [Tanacetum cinerariifolium]